MSLSRINTFLLVSFETNNILATAFEAKRQEIILKVISNNRYSLHALSIGIFSLCKLSAYVHSNGHQSEKRVRKRWENRDQ